LDFSANGVRRRRRISQGRVVKSIRRISFLFVFSVLHGSIHNKNGAVGILIGGCHFGDCHYQDGNYKTARRIALLHTLLKEMGIDKRRLRLEWISAAEGERFTQVVAEFTKQIKELGPIKGNGA
jgi:coenzyme F420-reducing hydrogenase delta subunit